MISKVSSGAGSDYADSAQASASPRFLKFAALYSKSFSNDSSCALTQDELDRVLGNRK
jgi:hypothetical protein